MEKISSFILPERGDHLRWQYDELRKLEKHGSIKKRIYVSVGEIILAVLNQSATGVPIFFAHLSPNPLANL